MKPQILILILLFNNTTYLLTQNAYVASDTSNSQHIKNSAPQTYTIINYDKLTARLPYLRDFIIKRHHQLVESQKKKVQLLTNHIQYLQKSAQSDTTIAWFIKNDNYAEFYPCYLQPYAVYCQKQPAKNKNYCYNSVETMKELLNKYKLPMLCNDTNNTRPFLPENIKPLSDLEYAYTYDYKKEFYTKHPEGRCVQYGHRCLLVDVLKHDKQNSIMFILTFNFPGKYYSLMMYDYANQIAYFDIQLLYNINLEKLYTHSGKTYYIYWAKHLMAYTKNYKLTPITDIYTLFTLYDKMKLKEIYHISTNQHAVKNKQ